MSTALLNLNHGRQSKIENLPFYNGDSARRSTNYLHGSINEPDRASNNHREEFMSFVKRIFDALSNQDFSLHCAAQYYRAASQHTGSQVKVLSEFQSLPMLIGKDNSIVLLYEFFNEVEDLIDYDDIKARFPALSYGQIASGMAFLRRLAQFNTKGIDIDEMEDATIESDEEFKSVLRDSLSDNEVIRVLTNVRRDR